MLDWNRHASIGIEWTKPSPLSGLAGKRTRISALVVARPNESPDDSTIGFTDQTTRFDTIHGNCLYF